MGFSLIQVLAFSPGIAAFRRTLQRDTSQTISGSLQNHAAAQIAHPAHGDCYSSFDHKPLLEFSINSQEELQEILNKLEDHDCVELGEHHKPELSAICSPDQAAELATLYGKNVEVVHKDAGAYYRNMSGVAQRFAESSVGMSSTFYSQWRDLEAQYARMEHSVSDSAGLARIEEIGSSVQGRPIKAVRFAGSGWESGKPRVVVDCQIHAREWITGMSCVYAVEMAAKKLKENPDWLDSTALDIVPMGNPDGFLYSMSTNRWWRKNMADNQGSSCKGVDLNRNWEPDWAGSYSSSGSLCSEVYHGPSAFSEPETQAIKKLLDEAPVTLHLDVHSYGEMILPPWSYTYDLHPRRKELDVPGMAMQKAVKGVHGKVYKYADSRELYPASGVCADYISAKGGLGYTYELRPGRRGGGGFAPPATSILPTAEEFLQGVYAAVSWAQNPVTTPAPPKPKCAWHCWYSGCTNSACVDCPGCQ